MRWSKPYHQSHSIPRITNVQSKHFEFEGFVDLEGCPHADMTGWPINGHEVAVGAPLKTCGPEFIEYK